MLFFFFLFSVFRFHSLLHILQRDDIQDGSAGFVAVQHFLLCFLIRDCIQQKALGAWVHWTASLCFIYSLGCYHGA
ncbi:uncharacterized protein P884DRAFT_258533 [Thermothelomyces heterothallicus CBS 202.75]|uniref:uncharacterized protein n=1 Tax=Thermothelomyces heterothallicus CBS 202.75 TaxID=1149848 RepID=UPI0037447843